MTTLVLMKYPQSVLDTLDRSQALPSDADAGATEAGIEIANRVGKNLMGAISGNYTVWSGPAARCADPARSMSGVIGAELKISPSLAERAMIADGKDASVGDLRSRQEKGFLDPTRPEGASDETPYAHRMRVELWLSDLLSRTCSEEVHVVISHGAVIEHIHSSLHWKPPGAMSSTFSFCAPGHAHVWKAVELPDGRRIWCALASNCDVSQPEAIGLLMRGITDLEGLTVDLASDPRFQGLVGDDLGEIVGVGDVYYIR